jgi:tau tubulin kinase
MAQHIVQLQPGSMFDRFRIEKKLGEGAFGAVYKVVDPHGTDYALKVEDANEEVKLLQMEVILLKTVNERNSRHFCQIADKGNFGSVYYVAMTMVGQSLQDLRKAAPGHKLSMGCAISVGIQCLEALEDMHSIGYLHRDVKPGNYAVGRAERNELRKVYMLDFGMCRRYIRDDGTGTPRTPRVQAGFRGTVRYASINCHKSMELSRKDDLETWMYQQVELTKGALPWRNVQDPEEVGRYKERCRTDIGIKELLGGCPRRYEDILRYIDKIRYYDVPNYQEIYGLMRRALASMRVNEFPYDWEQPARPFF